MCENDMTKKMLAITLIYVSCTACTGGWKAASVPPQHAAPVLQGVVAYSKFHFLKKMQPLHNLGRFTNESPRLF